MGLHVLRNVWFMVRDYYETRGHSPGTTRSQPRINSASAFIQRARSEMSDGGEDKFYWQCINPECTHSPIPLSIARNFKICPICETPQIPPDSNQAQSQQLLRAPLDHQPEPSTGSTLTEEAGGQAQGSNPRSSAGDQLEMSNAKVISGNSARFSYEYGLCSTAPSYY